MIDYNKAIATMIYFLMTDSESCFFFLKLNTIVLIVAILESF